MAGKQNVLANMIKWFALIWGQCSDQLQSVIRLHPDYEDRSSDFDGIWLLQRVEENVARLSQTKHIAVHMYTDLYNTSYCTHVHSVLHYTWHLAVQLIV